MRKSGKFKTANGWRWLGLPYFALMHERIGLIDHHGKQVLLVDLSSG